MNGLIINFVVINWLMIYILSNIFLVNGNLFENIF
jgi:hypothetical protein